MLPSLVVGQACGFGIFPGIILKSRWDCLPGKFLNVLNLDVCAALIFCGREL